MKLKDYQFVFYHNQWGQDSLEQDYDYTTTYHCLISDLVVGQEVNWSPKWNDGGWWAPTFVCKQVFESGVVLTINSTTSVNVGKKAEDVLFNEENQEWGCSLYGGRTHDGYKVVLEKIDSK